MKPYSGRVWWLGLALFSVGLAGVMFLGGCEKKVAEATAGGQAAGPQVVRVGYFANLTHAQAVLGVASGEIEKAISPAKLETRVFNAGPSLVEAIIAGEVDIGYVGPGPAVAAYTTSNGRALKVISGAAANGVSIVARGDSAIHSLKDLVGQRLATPQMANTQDIAARHYLKSELQQADLGNVMPIPNAEQVSMMQRGTIDAAWVPEPWGARLEIETKARLIAEEKELWGGKDFATTVVVASPKFIEQYPDTVAKVLEVHDRWTAKLQADAAGQLPALKAALFALTSKKMPEGTLEQAIGRVKFTSDPQFASIVTMAGWTYDLWFAKQPPRLEGLVEERFAIRPAVNGGGDLRK